MKLLKKIWVLILIVILVLLLGRWYLGGFSTPVATEKVIEPYIMAYSTFTGDYKNVGPTMNKLYDALSGAGIKSSTGIGIFYDSPTAVSGTSMKSEVGSIITQADFAKLDKKSPDYSLKTMKGGNMVMVEFPYRNTLSYIVWPIKVYPVENAYMEAKWYNLQVPRVEIYDVIAKKIYYMAEIIK